MAARLTDLPLCLPGHYGTQQSRKPSAGRRDMADRDRHRFDSLRGDLAVTGAAIMRSGRGRALTLDIEKLT